MHPIVIKHFSEISAAEYHRIVQADRKSVV